MELGDKCSCCCSVAVESNSLGPYELEHTRFPGPSLSPGVCSNSTESVMLFKHLLCCPFSSCSPSFPASGSFPMSWLFPSGGQSTGISAPSSVLPVNILGWYPLRLTDLISLLSKELSRVFSITTVSNCNWIRWVGHRVCLVMEKWLNLNIKDSMKTHIIETYHWFFKLIRAGN